MRRPFPVVYGLLLAMNSLARGESEAVITGICDSGPPVSLGLTGRAGPGALFFVLQPVSERQAWSYGTLTQEEKGDIFFEGKKVKTLHELARRVHPKTRYKVQGVRCTVLSLEPRTSNLKA